MTEQRVYSNGRGGAFLQAVRQYRERGLSLVPTEGKDAFVRGWQEQGTPPEKDVEYWGNGKRYNVGLVLGAPSGGLVDVDRDCDLPERVEKHFLPDTCMSGREERPFSHSWYYCRGLRSRALYDADGEKFLEVRSDGTQTVVAPSVHPVDGDRYLWHKETGNISTVDPETLTRAVNEYATALLLAIHIPPVGSRHDYAMAAAGFLLKSGRLDADTVYRIFLGAWKAQGVDTTKTVKELEDIVCDTAEKLAAGDEVKGGGVLGELVEGLPKRISRVWGWSRGDHGDQGQSDNERARKNAAVKGPKEAPPTHDELRDRLLINNPNLAFGLGEWQRYGDGIYAQVPEVEVKGLTSDVLEDAKFEGVKPTLSAVNSVTALAQFRAFVRDALWDADPDILVCANGALHIPSSELRPHGKEHYATSAVPYDYDPYAKAPCWRFLLNSFVGEVQDFLQEFAGYAITTETDLETAVWLYGPPGSGKSTFLLGLETMLGARAGTLGLADIERTHFALAGIAGKTLLTAAEQPSAFLRSTHIINQLISGEKLRVEQKYRDGYDLIPRAKLAWAMNELPRVGDANSGIFRRVKVVAFPAIAPEDRYPEIKAGIAHEGPGILNWALEGLRRLRERGRFEVPEAVQSATDSFRESNDVVAAFAEERCDRTNPDASEASSALYREYKSWCEDNGHRPLSSTRIAEEWKRLGLQPYKSKGKARYRGVRLRMSSE